MTGADLLWRVKNDAVLPVRTLLETAPTFRRSLPRGTRTAARTRSGSTLDEIKTRQGGPRLILRSQHPRGTEQEIFAFVLVHHALGELTHQAARQSDQAPDRAFPT